jgi:hypothetical protein
LVATRNPSKSRPLDGATGVDAVLSTTALNQREAKDKELPAFVC